MTGTINPTRTGRQVKGHLLQDLFCFQAQEDGDVFVLTKVSCSADRILIEYATDEDLGFYYNLGPGWLLGTMETATATAKNVQSFHPSVLSEERDYIRKVLNACKTQGFAFREVVFTRLMPIPEEAVTKQKSSVK